MRRWLFIMFFLLFSCEEQKDLPLELDITEPPVPFDFVVTMPTLGDYYLSWEVSDTSSVAYYRVYIYDPFFGPTMVDSTVARSYHPDFDIMIIAETWGVSCVALEDSRKIEGRIVYASVSSP